MFLSRGHCHTRPRVTDLSHGSLDPAHSIFSHLYKKTSQVPPLCHNPYIYVTFWFLQCRKPFCILNFFACFSLYQKYSSSGPLQSLFFPILEVFTCSPLLSLPPYPSSFSFLYNMHHSVTSLFNCLLPTVFCIFHEKRDSVYLVHSASLGPTA